MKATDYFLKHEYNLRSSSRKQAMNYIVNQNIEAPELIKAIYRVADKQKIVLYHVLDMVVEKNSAYLNKHLDLYLEKALNESHESIKRCVSRTLYHQLKFQKNSYTHVQKKHIANTMFDWIILPSLVATRVNAIHILYFLSALEPWIKEQLTALIEQNMQLQEPSFVSRGKKILKLLHKQKT